MKLIQQLHKILARIKYHFFKRVCETPAILLEVFIDEGYRFIKRFCKKVYRDELMV